MGCAISKANNHPIQAVVVSKLSAAMTLPTHEAVSQLTIPQKHSMPFLTSKHPFLFSRILFNASTAQSSTLALRTKHSVSPS